MSRFVVPIPFWVYLLALIIVIGVSTYALAFGLILAFIFFLITKPKETLVVVAVLLVIKYWKIALPILGVLWIANYLMKKKGGGNHTTPQLEKQ